MAMRMMEHMLQYGEPSIRRAVPLAIALLSMSNPELTVTDTLGRLSHDNDEEVRSVSSMRCMTVLFSIPGLGFPKAPIQALFRYIGSGNYPPQIGYAESIEHGLLSIRRHPSCQFTHVHTVFSPNPITWVN